MRIRLAIPAVALALGALTACAGPTRTVVVEHAPPPLASSAPAPTPTESGVVYSGTENCAFNASDGDVTVYVVDQNVADCTEVSAALAAAGVYWNPDTYSMIETYQQTGALPDSDRWCLLSNGGEVMAVYGVSNVQEPIDSGLAGRICQSEEQNGWTAEAAQ
jgi:hypothetical protein